MDRELLTSVRNCCAELTEKNPKSAIDFLSNYNHPSTSTPLVLFAGIGDGLGQLGPNISHVTNDISLGCYYP